MMGVVQFVARTVMNVSCGAMIGAGVVEALGSRSWLPWQAWVTIFCAAATLRWIGTR